jgi:hypothetical protein
MRPVIDYSKDLRQKLADGKTPDQALSELRAAGASICDCIVSVRTFRRCEIAEAKQIVQSSPVWSDYRNATEEFVRELNKTDENNVA